MNMNMITLCSLETEKALLTQRIAMSGFAQAFKLQRKLDKINEKIAARKLAEEERRKYSDYYWLILPPQ